MIGSKSAEKTALDIDCITEKRFSDVTIFKRTWSFGCEDLILKIHFNYFVFK